MEDEEDSLVDNLLTSFRRYFSIVLHKSRQGRERKKERKKVRVPVCHCFLSFLLLAGSEWCV